ncbi:hypothetical protein WISP_117600 [Willisornis vidua]|uniref:Uncharacterized protein n=1 Tax=Willisornis vidua TaxID=1566151 RepID=A0ABQ9CTE9_9PASS|nr:hypothetical protein WISP_117600 [Willisornis vidua]
MGYKLWRSLFPLHDGQTQNNPLKPVVVLSILPTMYGINGSIECDFQTVFQAAHSCLFLLLFKRTKVGSLQSSPMEEKNTIVRNLESEVVTGSNIIPQKSYIIVDRTVLDQTS